MDVVTQKKWDRAAANFDLMASFGPEKRWLPYKRELFGNCLLYTSPSPRD